MKINDPSLTIGSPDSHTQSIKDIVNQHFDAINPDRLQPVSPELLPNLSNSRVETLIGKLVMPDGTLNPEMSTLCDHFIEKAEQRLSQVESEFLSDPELNTEENRGIFSTIKNIFGMVKSWISGEYTPPLDQIVQGIMCIALLVLVPLPTVIDDFILLQKAMGHMNEVLDDYEDWKFTQNA